MGWGGWSCNSLEGALSAQAKPGVREATARPASSRHPPLQPPFRPHVGATLLTLGSGRTDPMQGQQSPNQQPPHGAQPWWGGSAPFYNPGWVGYTAASTQEIVYAAVTRSSMCPGGAELATPALPPPLRSEYDPGGAPGRRGMSKEKEKKPRSRTRGAPAPSPPDPTSSPRRGGLCDLVRSRAGLRNKPTTSGNFLLWPRCPPPAPSPPPGWDLRADAVTAVPDAGPPGLGWSRVRRQARARGSS